MGQHYPDDMARKRQERRVNNREWRTEALDELALLRRPVGRSEAMDELAKSTAEAVRMNCPSVVGPFVCGCGNHLPCRHCDTPEGQTP